ncbi:MAG: N-acetylneuraminate synthase family protein [Paenibacillaceae bacterium]|nr:N-acetylneuraminate synthase family protein [Paenibacillaceae bacterium]
MSQLQSLFRHKSCLLVAEVGQAHDGSLGTAYAMVDAAAEAGADAVKFQTHIAAEESTPAEPWRVPFSVQDKSRYEYWKRMEFSSEMWFGLAAYARSKGLLFLSSPFSVAAADMLAGLDMPLWKVASGEVANLPLIDRMLATGAPLLISTGLCTIDELDACVARARSAGREFLVLQCTTAYPCPPEKIGLNLLDYYSDRYQCRVGLSDHSGTIFPGIVAAAIGAAIVEVHVVFSKRAFGPDVSSSLTFEQLRELADGMAFVERMRRHPLDKAAAVRELEPLRHMFARSLVARTDLPAGTVLAESMVAAKKPGGGMPPERLPAIVGRTLRRPVTADEPFADDDFDAIAHPHGGDA